MQAIMLRARLLGTSVRCGSGRLVSGEQWACSASYWRLIQAACAGRGKGSGPVQAGEMVLRNSLQLIQQGGEWAHQATPHHLHPPSMALKCVTVGCCDWVFHWHLSDGAHRLAKKAGDWSFGCGL